MSLFDTIMDAGEGASDNLQTESNASSGGPETSEQASWWWDDKTPGTGERPEWLPAKYKSAADAARAFKELEKKLGAAPSEYDWSKGKSWVDTDYLPFQELADFAKSKHVTQDVMDKMLETVGDYLDEFSVDYSEERAALGDNAEDRLRVLNNWAKSNFSEDAYHALTSSMRTADAVKAIEEIRLKMIENNTTIPTGNESPQGMQSLEDIQTEMTNNLEKYKNDPAYRKEIQAKISMASKDSRYVDKHY